MYLTTERLPVANVSILGTAAAFVKRRADFLSAPLPDLIALTSERSSDTRIRNAVRHFVATAQNVSNPQYLQAVTAVIADGSPVERYRLVKDLLPIRRGIERQVSPRELFHFEYLQWLAMERLGEAATFAGSVGRPDIADRLRNYARGAVKELDGRLGLRIVPHDESLRSLCLLAAHALDPTSLRSSRFAFPTAVMARFGTLMQGIQAKPMAEQQQHPVVNFEGIFDKGPVGPVSERIHALER